MYFSIKLNKKCRLVQIFSIYFLFIKSKRLLFAILSSQFENVYNCPRYLQKFQEK
ncbi:thymidylate kinase [Haemophilus influenzae]|nr:thymidylate kinase [Haemophilus influenzae]AXP75704.1 thymidylate kinase [Haemophilus influenzae]RFN79870.1 thymidylate kinase [Haemophilus influenzae]RFO72431.1 thymidylate kinase [Haemophilus influenzae]